MTSKKNKPSEPKLKKLKNYMLKTGDPKVGIVCELLGKYAQIKVLRLYISEIYENSGLDELSEKMEASDESSQ